MTGWMVALLVLAVLWLIGRLRLGGLVRYGEDGLLARLIAGPFRITLYPVKKPKKEKKPREKAKKTPKKAPEEAPKTGGALPPFAQLLPLVGEAAGQMKRKLRIDELTVHLTWATSDPAQTALGFARANAVMGMIWPLIDQNFKVKKHDLGVAVNFDQPAPTVFCSVALTMTLGQLLAFGLRFGGKFLVLMSRSRKSSAKKQEA